ncbi:MAG TPA: redox-sensitive transcriptional activator SoxR [Streptosporangiaceae bacterium]|nr:redox-sensitive transcriptional activator SoxR [Streptosporangiaceae bacterium]
MAASGHPDLLTISELSARSGAAPSALRYYERLGLIRATRTAGNQRRYPRHMLRRVAFIRAGRRLGLELRTIQASLALLPEDRAPTRAEWSRAARSWQARIDAKISDLQRMSETLTSCIGCGCLSLRRCSLYNPADTAAQLGAGARWLLGDEPPADAARSGSSRVLLRRQRPGNELRRPHV